jgi:hypothetical protein
VCDVQVDCDPAFGMCSPPEPQPGAQGYEVGVRCAESVEPFNVSVTAGADGDTLFACEDSASATDPVTLGAVTFETVQGGSIEARCVYEGQSGTPDPYECSGTLHLEVGWSSFGITARLEPNTLHVGAIAVALGESPPGTLDATATIACPGQPVLDLPMDGNTLEFADLLPAGSDVEGSCDVVVRFASDVVAEGDALHTVTVFAEANPRSCNNSADCAPGLRCGPSGCQLGDQNDPCTTPFTPVDPDLDLPPLGDCNDTAPICATFGRCTNGFVGSGCRSDVDCEGELHCTSPIFGLCAP